MSLTGPILLGELRKALEEIKDWPDNSRVIPDKSRYYDQRDPGAAYLTIEWRDDVRR